MLWIASFAMAISAKGNQLFRVMFIVPFVFADVVYFNPILAATKGASLPVSLADFFAHFRPVFTVAATCSVPISFPWIGVEVVG